VTEKIKIALIGNPNTGKTSLFNALTGLRQKTGNFPGITIEKKTGYIDLNKNLIAEITDLPGTYSLFARTADEAIPLEILLNDNHPQHPELVVYIADATNLKRNLILLTQIIDLKFPVILVLNMIDQAEAQGVKIDLAKLEENLGIPVVATNARKKTGLPKLLSLMATHQKPSTLSFFGKHLNEVEHIQAETHSPVRFKDALHYYKSKNKTLFQKYGQEAPDIADYDSGVLQREDLLYRHKKTKAILDEIIHKGTLMGFKKRQDRLDKILTHKFWGYVIFLAILFLIFQSIFDWAAYPMKLIENTFSWLANSARAVLPPGILSHLICDGILAGLSGVLVFIPQIAFLFFFITVLEDTGYLARVAFLMDRIMRKFGMNGKSVVPLISGTACAVPAILATRSIEGYKARLITIMVTPLMSCSARLPVFILLIGIAIPSKMVFGLLNMQGLALMAMYLLGFFAALGGAMVFNAVLKPNKKQYFILELPVYRFPNWRNIVHTVIKKVQTFISQAGKIIVAISIVLWFLASYGPGNRFENIDKKYASSINYGSPEQKKAIEIQVRTEKLENSYAGEAGKLIEPIIRPLGYDWKIGIAIITSFAAREVFVGTMSTLYGLEGQDPNFSQLKTNMQKAKYANGASVYSFATAISLLLFYVFAMQCMSTLAVTYRETMSWKWTMIQLFYMSGLAYIASLIAYQLLK